MKKIFLEKKILGINPIWISSLLILLLAVLAFVAGELLNLSLVGFEVIFPFYVAIAIGEWAKFKSDKNFDIIVSQTESIFRWVICRFLTVFGMITGFAVLGMIIVSVIRSELPIIELFFIYFSPAFFLASFATFWCLLFEEGHIATLICGVYWLIMILIRSMLRYKYVQYLYLFIRYAGDLNEIWIMNKIVLFGISCVIWIIIYLICKKKIKC